jgi:C-terminal processing protease CtpA/Prc
MLVDERTVSQAEHTGLFLEAANGTTFIGSPTMGANGDVTVFALPGGLTMSFSGHDVRHADGRQLQRVGLEPQVVVTPTIAGIRAGRDEVLEAGARYVGGSGEIPLDTVRENASNAKNMKRMYAQSTKRIQ